MSEIRTVIKHCSELKVGDIINGAKAFISQALTPWSNQTVIAVDVSKCEFWTDANVHRRNLFVSVIIQYKEGTDSESGLEWCP